MEEPIILFKEDDMADKIARWLGVDNDDVYTYFGIILSKLGFSSSDSINVYEIKNKSIKFIVNAFDDYCIRMGYMNVYEIPVIYIEKNGIEYGFRCLLDEYRYDVDLKLINCNDKDNDVNFSVDSSSKTFNYEVSNGEYRLELSVSNDPDNQDKLVMYLLSLEFPVSIFRVYEKICEISLGDDIGKYSLIDLRIFKNDEIKDFILVEDGKLENLSLVNDEDELHFGPGDEWKYENDKAMVTYSLTRTADSIDFNWRIKPKGDIDNYSSSMALEDINKAKKEMDNIKKLTRVMFSKKNSRR